MREGFAIVVAIFAAAVTATASAAALAYLFSVVPGGDILFGLLVAFFISFALVTIVGVPVALFLRHKGRFTLGPVIASGAIVGAVVPGLLIIPFEDSWHSYGPVLLASTVIGVISSSTFYGAHRLMSPNNSFNPTAEVGPIQ